MPSQLEKFPFFHPDNFQLDSLLNEITTGHLEVSEALSAPASSKGADEGSAAVDLEPFPLDIGKIKEELKLSLDDLVAFYESECKAALEVAAKKEASSHSSAEMFGSSEDFRMELRALAKKVTKMKEMFAEARQLNFQENIDDLSLLRTQQANLLSVKEILTLFEEIKRGQLDTLDFLVTSDTPTELLKVFYTFLWQIFILIFFI